MAAQLQLAVILPFVTGALQGLGEQRRSVAIVRSLRRAGNLAARAELVQCKQRSMLKPCTLSLDVVSGRVHVVIVLLPPCTCRHRL
jgi:hypothetical protein